MLKRAPSFLSMDDQWHHLVALSGCPPPPSSSLSSSSSFIHHPFTTSPQAPSAKIIPGSYPPPACPGQQQSGSGVKHRGFPRGSQLTSNKRNSNSLDRIPTNSHKKQALSTNYHILSSNPRGTNSSMSVSNLQRVPPMSKAHPQTLEITPTKHSNLVNGSAVSVNGLSNRRHSSHHSGTASRTSTSSSSPTFTQINSKELDSTKSSHRDAFHSRTSTPSVQHKSRSSHPIATHQRVTTAESPLTHPLLGKKGRLPDGVSLKRCGKNGTDVCVKATKAFEKGHAFGPLQGDVKTVDCLHNIHAWELCFYGNVAAYVVPRLKKEWMGYVRNARFPEECSLVADQVYGRIYFTVIRRIEPGSELRVFFSDVYRENCGFMYDLSALNYNKDADDFSCTMCDIRIKDSKSMVRHYKFTHPQCISRASPVRVRKRRHLLDDHPTLELDCSEEERSVGCLENEEDGGDEGEDEESDGSSSDGVVCMEDDGRDQSLHDGGVCKRLTYKSCGKNFDSHSQMLMHESFHEAEEGEEDLDEDNEGDVNEELTGEGDGVGSQRSPARSARSHNYEAKDQVAQDNAVKANDSNLSAMKPLLQESRVNNCTMCGFRTADDALFVVHISSHRSFPLGCRKCGNTYKRKRSLKVHMMTVHRRVSDDESESDPKSASLSSMDASASNLEVNRDPCHLCRYYTPHKSILAEHMERHKKYPHGCRDCGNTYSGLNVLYRHRREKHNDGYVRGPRLKNFVESVKLPDDLKVHEDTCTRCGFQCTDRGFLADHLFLHVTHPFGCSNCGNVYRTRIHLQRHMKEKHTPLSQEEGNTVKLLEEPQTCTKCGFTCPNRNILEEHRRKHRIAGYGCDVCGEVFPEDKFVVLHKQEKHGGFLLGGLKEEPVDIDGGEEDYFESGFIEIDVHVSGAMKAGDSYEQDEDVGDQN